MHLLLIPEHMKTFLLQGLIKTIDFHYISLLWTTFCNFEGISVDVR